MFLRRTPVRMRASKPLAGPRSLPRRTCVGCRSVREQARLVRIAADGAGGVRVSPGRGAGRGAYCCPRASCLEQVLRRKALPRALRCGLDRLDAEALRRSFVAAAGAMSESSAGSH
jgi:hypothetical protein